MAALLVYSIRRHRIDDYQGRYRIWLSAAAVCFLLATDHAASLREAFRDAMVVVTGTPLTGDGSLWWAVFYALVCGAVGSRVLMDMRSSFTSMGLLLLAALVHTLAVVGQLGRLLPADGHRVIYLTGAEMLGNVLLLAAMMAHARHVILDAEGLLLRDEPPPEEEGLAETEPPEAEEDDGDTRWMKIDAPHAIPQPVFQRAETSMSKSTVSPSISTSVSPPLNRKLTKGERKTLKERLLRERMQRER